RTMSQHDPLIGQTLQGRFTIVRLLAQGGMGAVYRAVQPDEPREVAVKVLHPDNGTDATRLPRFQREAEAMMRIQHPNAVRVYAQGVENEIAYLVMELVKGPSVKDRLTARGKLSADEAVDILVPVCEALAATHGAGVIHRDLKPDNIMLTGEGSAPGGEQVKLLDFGLAKPLDDQPGQGLTALGSVVGTPAYMAPEQISGRPITAATDIYAAGVLLYELVTGKLPYDSSDPMRICWLHLYGEIAPPSTLTPGLSPALERAILKALSRQPAERQQSAIELRDDLRAALASIPEPLQPSAIPATVRVTVSPEADESVETLPVHGPEASASLPRSGKVVVLPPPAAVVAQPAHVVVRPPPPKVSINAVPTVMPARRKRSFLSNPVTAIAAGVALAIGLAALAVPLLLH
ncbi:MAG: protein kinase, partial [Minicystis sp.]